MRLFLFGWLTPFGLFWSWFFLSRMDIGWTFWLSAEFHEAIMFVYSDLFGVEKDGVACLIKSCAPQTRSFRCGIGARNAS